MACASPGPAARNRRRSLPMAGSVVEATGFLLGQRGDRPVLAQVVQRPVEVIEQEACQVPAEVVPYQDPLDGEILPVRRQSVSRYLPAPGPQPVRHVKQREPGRTLGQLPRDGRYAAAARIDHLERTCGGQRGREVLRVPVTGLMNPPVAVPAQPQEVVVLGDDLDN